MAADIAFVVAVVLDIADDITVYISKDWNRRTDRPALCAKVVKGKDN